MRVWDETSELPCKVSKEVARGPVRGEEEESRCDTRSHLGTPPRVESDVPRTTGEGA